MANIQIFNPKTKFGPLSNNSVSMTTINKKRWKTITHFVYAMILCRESYQDVIREQPDVKLVKPTSIEFYLKCLNDIIVSAMRKGYMTKFKTNPQFVSALLATGNSILQYVSGNPFLGMGNDEKGQNVLGNFLMDLRHQYRLKFEKQSEQLAQLQVRESELNRIFLIHIAFNALNRRLTEGKDIKEFKDKPYKQIIDELNEPYIDKIVVLQLYERGNFDNIEMAEIENPGHMVFLLRKRELENLRQRLLTQKQHIIWN